MDKTIVGNNAGKVWCALKEIGEISIPELARRLNLSVESTACTYDPFFIVLIFPIDWICTLFAISLNESTLILG